MIKLSDFDNDYTINIFSDASMSGKIGCYGVIIVHARNIIYQNCVVMDQMTNNRAEILGVREAIMNAINLRGNFPVINVFSDSQISIAGIRDRILNWSLDKNGLICGYNGTTIASQDIFFETLLMMVENQFVPNLWHQMGHVVTYNKQSLFKALHVFMASNGIRDNVDTSLIRYISNYNNYIDKETRLALRKKIVERNKKISKIPQEFPLEFTQHNFNLIREEYRSLCNK